MKERAKSKTEICGIIVGKKLSENIFEITDLIEDCDSLKNPSPSGVIRYTKNIINPLEDSIQTNNNIDWIGEWHTHPKGKCEPSLLDIQTMISLLEDPDYGNPCEVVLIIAGFKCVITWIFHLESKIRIITKAEMVENSDRM